MDAIDNLIFATLRSPLYPAQPIESDYLDLPTAFGGFAPVDTHNPASSISANYVFTVPDKEAYCSFDDSGVIEKAISRHWYDINGYHLWAGSPPSPPLPPASAQGFQYNWPGSGVISDFTQSPTYHLFYAYLLENTRILQIFERVIDRYMQDEELGIAQAGVYQWMQNTEKLFFHDTPSHNIRSLIRPLYDANRRNAYNRMFGVDLAFGGVNSETGSNLPYFKAKVANQQFIPLFERYLSEIWQGYINARNTSGANSTDVNNAVDLADQIQELLQARRGSSINPGGTTRNAYANSNLSREEFSSVILLSWFAFIVSDNTNVVQFLNCQSSTIGERLIKIGNKVGVPAHSKSQAIFELAGAATQILNLLEIGGALDDPGWVQTMLSSLNPPVTPAVFVPTQQSDYMNYFLTVINNWEKATGHRIKNPEVNVMNNVRVTPQQVRSNANGNGNGRPLPVTVTSSN